MNEPEIEVSFDEVAAESPDESVAQEGDALDAAGDGPAAPDGESANDTPPEEPTISSMLGGGPVGEGDQAEI